jgi:hypothetical protein
MLVKPDTQILRQIHSAPAIAPEFEDGLVTDTNIAAQIVVGQFGGHIIARLFADSV